MESDETATATTGGSPVIGVFDGDGAPSGPNILLFSGADRLLEVSRGRSGSGYAPVPHTPALGGPESSGSHCQVIHARMGCFVERIGR